MEYLIFHDFQDSGFQCVNEAVIHNSKGLDAITLRQLTLQSSLEHKHTLSDFVFTHPVLPITITNSLNFGSTSGECQPLQPLSIHSFCLSLKIAFHYISEKYYISFQQYESLSVDEID